MLTISFSFEALEKRFGETVAYAYLEHIERASGVSPIQMTGTAPEVRLRRAITAQDQSTAMAVASV